MKTDIRKHVGKLVKNLKNLHDIEYKVVFSLQENTFFQKIIPKEILEKGVRVTPPDYFKALIFLSYFTGIVEDNYQVCGNLVNLSKALRADEREREENGEASYLNLDAVVIESALFAKEKYLRKKAPYSEKRKLEEIKKRYSNEASIDLNSENIRKLDPYYEAIGEMVCSQVGEKLRTFLQDTTRRTELGALIFTDSILPLLTETESKKIYESLARKDYFIASLTALNELVRKASISKLESAVMNKNGN